MNNPERDHQNCPDCDVHMHICDNSCGTYYCPDCKKDWHKLNGVLVLGHVVECGESDDFPDE